MLLKELRSNPALNPRIDPFEVVKQHYGDREVFLNFTKTPKLGINPKSTHNTPQGIYAYPLGSETIVSQFERNDLPYAGNNQYINLIRATGNIIDFNEDRDWKELSRAVVLPAFKKLKWVDNDPPSEETFFIELWGLSIQQSKQNSDVSVFWCSTMIMTLALMSNKALYKSGSFGLSRAYHDYGYVNSAIWTKLFLQAKIDGFVDYGNKIIHVNEPFQAVFFNPSNIKIIARLDNPRSKAVFFISDSNSLKRALYLIGPDREDYFIRIISWYFLNKRPISFTVYSKIYPSVSQEIRLKKFMKTQYATPILINYMRKNDLYSPVEDFLYRIIFPEIVHPTNDGYDVLKKEFLKLWLASLHDDRSKLIALVEERAPSQVKEFTRLLSEI